nr:PorP/SprF family type IX secretion system membrane protein [Bacteroidota bacterium]
MAMEYLKKSMKANVSKLLLAFLILLYTNYGFSQDIHFSQFNMSPLTLNPAMAGAMDDIQLNLISREQWRSLGAPFRTTSASYDMRLNPDKRAKTGYWGFGFNVFSDKAGDGNLGVNQANLSLAYHLFLDDNNSLGAGLQAGFAQRSINFTSLTWGKQFDGLNHNPNLPTGEAYLPASKAYADVGAGITWAFNPRMKAYAGKTNQAFKS